MSGEGPFRPAPGLGRVGSYHGYTKMGHCSAELSRVAFVNLAACFGGIPVMTAAIRVEAAEQAALLDDISYTT